MRLVMFNDFVPGVLDGSRVVDISPAVSEIPHMSPQELMSGIIADFDSLKGNIDDLVSSSDGDRLVPRSVCDHPYRSLRRSSRWPRTIWSTAPALPPR